MPEPEQEAVELCDMLDGFMRVMRRKILEAWRRGVHGWNDPKIQSTGDLCAKLRKNMGENDFIDVANYAMFLWARQVEEEGEDKSPPVPCILGRNEFYDTFKPTRGYHKLSVLSAVSDFNSGKIDEIFLKVGDVVKSKVVKYEHGLLETPIDPIPCEGGH